jgi:hypothetical protein
LEVLLDEFDDERIRADMVWTPAWGTENQEAAEDLTAENRDGRERVWYDAAVQIGSGWGEWIAGPEPVYDVMAIYDPGTDWDLETGTPGEPAWYDRGGYDIDEVKAEIEARLPICDVIDLE